MAKWQIEIDGSNYELEGGNNPPTEQEARQAVGEFSNLRNISPMRQALDISLQQGLPLYGAYRLGKKGLDWWRKPQQQLLKPLETQLQGIRGQYPELAGKTPVALEDLPNFLLSKTKDIALQQKNIKSIETTNLSNSLKALDKTQIYPVIDETVNIIKTNYPNWIQSGSEAFEVGVKASEAIMRERGAIFKSRDFYDDVLMKTLKEAQASGSLAFDELKALTKLVGDKRLSSVKRNMQINEALGLKVSIINSTGNPFGKIATLLRKNWGKFLQKNAPQDVVNEISMLNKNFGQFADLKNTLEGIIEPTKGIYQKQKAINYFLDYITGKRKISSDLEGGMKVLTEGGGLTAPIQGLKEKFGRIGKLKQSREQISQQTQQRLAAALSKLEQQKATLSQQGKQSEILLSNIKEVGKKYPVRAGSGTKRILGQAGGEVIRGGIRKILFPALAIYPTLSQALGIKKFSDVQDIASSQLSGIPPETYQAIRSAFQKLNNNQQISEEERKLLEESGLIT